MNQSLKDSPHGPLASPCLDHGRDVRDHLPGVSFVLPAGLRLGARLDFLAAGRVHVVLGHVVLGHVVLVQALLVHVVLVHIDLVHVVLNEPSNLRPLNMQ